MSVRSGIKNVPILMYHNISLHATRKYKLFAVPPALFADHMAYLHRHAYTPITVTQFINARAKGSSALPERPVILTFDDGFADFFTDAFPVLQRFGFTATLYVATAFVNGTSRWLHREGEAACSMLTWDQLTGISTAGIECGGHSHCHPQLDILPIVVARDEIVQCKRLLERHLGQEVFSFAYPYGYHTAIIKQLVREAGYSSACAVKYEMSSEATDPFALARLMMKPSTSVGTLAALLTQRHPSAITAMYKRARVPVWRITRRCLAPVMLPLGGGRQHYQHDSPR
jgi:peptidoglycan/xylan/chitin deacetylase (PgdA/CDA1 family)